MTIYSIATISITLFLNEQFSVFFIGVFMAMTNLVSTFTDVPIGYLQKIVPQKILLIFSILGVMAAMAIFILANNTIVYISFAAVLIYGAAYDVYAITTTSYLMDISSPDEYSQSLSQKGVADAIGLMFGLLIATVINFIPFINPFLVVLVLYALNLFFVMTIFDQAEYDTSLDKLGSDMIFGKLAPAEMAGQLKDFFVSTAINGLEKVEEASHALKETMNNKSVIVVKPIQPLEAPKKESMIDGMKDSFKSLFHIFYPIPQWPLVWASLITMFYSLWDTFVTTFMLLFILEKVVKANGMNEMWGGVIIAIIVIPLFVCQIPFSKLADRFGKPFFIYAGSLLSAVAIVAVGMSTDVKVVVVAGIAISVGYAMAFPAAQGFFSQRFQEHYAKTHNTNVIDSNVSAGPMKTVIDVGNVIAQLAGGALISVIDFGPTFIFFGVLLFLIFAVGLVGISWILKPILATGESPVKTVETEIPPTTTTPTPTPTAAAV